MSSLLNHPTVSTFSHILFSIRLVSQTDTELSIAKRGYFIANYRINEITITLKFIFVSNRITTCLISHASFMHFTRMKMCYFRGWRINFAYKPSHESQFIIPIILSRGNNRDDAFDFENNYMNIIVFNINSKRGEITFPLYCCIQLNHFHFPTFDFSHI